MTLHNASGILNIVHGEYLNILKEKSRTSTKLRSSGSVRGWSMIDRFARWSISRTPPCGSSIQTSPGYSEGFNEPEGNERHALVPSCPRLLERPSHGPWSCLGRKRSTKRGAGVKVKGPTIAAECHRVVSEIHECVSRGSTRCVASRRQQLRSHSILHTAYRMTPLPRRKSRCFLRNLFFFSIIILSVYDARVIDF